MITQEQYFHGPQLSHRRDLRYANELTPKILANINILLPRVNALLDVMAKDKVYPRIDATTGTCVASGWRPQGVNAATQNSAKNSKHLIGAAIDCRDNDGDMDKWCMAKNADGTWKNIHWLVKLGLWLEHPGWTDSWCHVQCEPPEGRGVPYPSYRVFIPSSQPAATMFYGISPVII